MNWSIRRAALIAAFPALLAGIALAQPQKGKGGPPPGPPPGQDGQSDQGGQGGGQGGGGQGGGQGGGGQGGGQGNGQHKPTSRPSPDQIFDHADTNHDGSLSRAEFKAFLAHRPPPRANNN